MDQPVSIVTGAGSGIGRATAIMLAERGHRVTLVGRTALALEETAALIRERVPGATLFPCVADVCDLDLAAMVVDRTHAAWGRIDCLVCNAASNPHFGPLTTASDEVFDKVMSTNVKSVFWLANMVLPAMGERGEGGSMIIISSIGALRGSQVLGLYGTSKAAEAGLARALAVQWGPKNIRVNTIAPGLVKTDFAKALWSDETRRKSREASTPLRRIGEPKDIGGVAVFLACEAGSFVTGQMIVADGGVTISGS